MRCLSAISVCRSGIWTPGTGKTESARYDAQWEQVESFLPESLITFSGRSAVDEFYPYKPFTFASAQSSAPLLKCRTVFYTAPVAASPVRIERQVLALFAAFSYLMEAANERHQDKEDFLVMHRSSQFIELLIVDEANRLKDAGLEQIQRMYLVFPSFKEAHFSLFGYFFPLLLPCCHLVAQFVGFGKRKIDPYLPYLRERWDAGVHNNTRLFGEMKERGYTGCQ